MILTDIEDDEQDNLMWNEEEQNLYIKEIDEDESKYRPTCEWEDAVASYKVYIEMLGVDKILLEEE